MNAADVVKADIFYGEGALYQTMRDPESGLSLRFIRRFDATRALGLDHFGSIVAADSCRWLGHTFRYNGPSESHCQVCHVPNPAYCAPADACLGAVED